MVITVTLNPAMDKTLTMKNFSLGKVNRVSSIRYDIGGKGINVSKVLKNFNIDSICTGFLGGIWERIFYDELKKRNIDFEFMHIDGNTRTNTKVVDAVNNVYTDINESGPIISEDVLNKFLEQFENMCKKDDIVVLSGGVSSSVSKGIYKTMTERAKKQGAFVILDADGELLEEGIKGKPDIIKPNQHELGELFKIDENDERKVIDAAKKLLSGGISKVLVSCGEKGAFYITPSTVYHTDGLRVPVKSTVGAGDSMVAALVYSKIKKLDDAKTLKFAAACGAASVTLEGTEACSKKQVDELLKRVEVTIREVF